MSVFLHKERSKTEQVRDGGLSWVSSVFIWFDWDSVATFSSSSVSDIRSWLVSNKMESDSAELLNFHSETSLGSGQPFLWKKGPYVYVGDLLYKNI